MNFFVIETGAEQAVFPASANTKACLLSLCSRVRVRTCPSLSCHRSAFSLPRHTPSGRF
jgi:hypothetical protein